jgi:hypothetical protein
MAAGIYFFPPQKIAIFAAGRYSNPVPFTIPVLTTFRRCESAFCQANGNLP